MTIPIITLNWNGIHDTLECMESLMQQTYTDFVVYLVDNGSDANNVQQLKAHFGTNPRVQLVFNATNLGFTKGNNAILEQIIQNPAYPYVVLLNNDTTQAPDWLQQLVESAQRHQADMVTSKMVNYFDRSKMDNAGHLMLNTAEIIPLGHNEPVEAFDTFRENIGACAGAALYATDMLRAIGVFDEYFETGYEDAELGLRANILGYKTVYEPKAVVYHKVKQSIKKIMNYEYVIKIQLNIFYAYFKLMPLGVLLLNLPSFLFKYAAIIVIDILFWRPKFLRVMVDAWYRTLFTERKTIRAARRAFYTQHRPIASWRILRKMTFFLWFDIKRFWKYVILKRVTVFEEFK